MSWPSYTLFYITKLISFFFFSPVPRVAWTSSVGWYLRAGTLPPSEDPLATKEEVTTTTTSYRTMTTTTWMTSGTRPSRTASTTPRPKGVWTVSSSFWTHRNSGRPTDLLEVKKNPWTLQSDSDVIMRGRVPELLSACKISNCSYPTGHFTFWEPQD